MTFVSCHDLGFFGVGMSHTITVEYNNKVHFFLIIPLKAIAIEVTYTFDVLRTGRTHSKICVGKEYGRKTTTIGRLHIVSKGLSVVRRYFLFVTQAVSRVSQSISLVDPLSPLVIEDSCCSVVRKHAPFHTSYTVEGLKRMRSTSR